MSAKTLPILDDHDALRPRTFGDCLRDGWGDDGTPCPWVSCAHHLAWAWAIRGDSGAGATCEPGDERTVDRLEAVLGDGDAWLLDAMPATCALRVAQEPRVLEEIGEVFGFTRARTQQIEARAMRAIDSYRNRPVLAELRDGREISRPDLAPETSETGQVAILRRLREIAPSERHGSQWIPAKVHAFVNASPVRVLAGAERAQRIAELKARGGVAPVNESKESAQEETVVMKPEADKESGARAFAALVKYAERRGVARSTAQQELRLSSSSVARFKTTGCSPALADRIAAALAALPEGDAAKAAPKAKPARREAKQAAAKPTPSTLTLDQLPRVIAVVERLGGIERAERIAAAIGGAL